MKNLEATRYEDAMEFLGEQGRPLERALCGYVFSQGDAGAVAEELAGFQNDDGGYGHSLEPDAVARESSVLDTTQALQIAERIKLPGDHPQVVAAMQYLRQTYDAGYGGWPIRPFASTETACAPWWKSKDHEAWQSKMQAGRFNPTAEVLGYFLRYGDDRDQALIQAVTGKVDSWIQQTPEPLEEHDLLCLARLTRAPGLSQDLRQAWATRVSRDVPARVNRDPAGWDAYGLKPWWVAEFPGDPLLAGLEPGLIDAMLDHEIGRQEADGGWPPFWSWGGLHPDEWAAARVAWKSVLTEQMLRVLRNFGRLPG